MSLRSCRDTAQLTYQNSYQQVRLWEKLGSLYQSKSIVNKLFLQEKMFHLRMDENDTVTEHLNVYNTLVIQITYVGNKMAGEDKCITLLCSLPDSWDNLIVAIGSVIQATLKFDEILSSLLSKEMRQKTMDNHSLDKLSVTGRPHERNKNKGYGGGSKYKGRSKSLGKGIRKCWTCGKVGNYKKDCRSKNVEK